MLYFLYHLEGYFGPARLFEYITFRAGGAGFTAFLLVVLLGNYTATKLKMLNAQASNRYAGILSPDKIDLAKEKTPSMGGILLIGAIIISAILWTKITNVIALILIISTLEFSLVGFYDDYNKVVRKRRDGIPGKVKLVCQFAIALSVIGTLMLVPETKGVIQKLLIPFFKEPFAIPYFISIPLALIAIIGSSNAVNLTDGKDGLVAGCMIFSMLSISIFAYLMGHRLLAEYLNLPLISGVGETLVFGSAIIGGCIGFLWHNCNPASMFMGDTGSLALGGALGTIAVILRQEILLVLIGGVFVMETLSVMLQITSIKLFKRKIFRCTPIHHHFEKNWGGSWSENQIVVRFWIIAGILALMALATLKLR